MENALNQFPVFQFHYPYIYWPAFASRENLMLINPPNYEQESKTRPSLKMVQKSSSEEKSKFETMISDRSKKIKSEVPRKSKLNKKREKEDDFERKKQKKDRNLPSNIFKYFIIFIYGHPQLQNTIDHLSPSGSTINASLLISKAKTVISGDQTYIRPILIQKLCWQQTLTPQERKIFRLLLRNFLFYDLKIIVVRMQKFKKKQKHELIKLGKKLFSQIKLHKFR